VAASLKLDTTPALTTARCDIISRAWAILGQLEDLRTDLKSYVRQTAERDRTADHFAAAATNLAVGAQLLVPVQLDPAA
jgi:hypothetical protein